MKVTASIVETILGSRARLTSLIMRSRTTPACGNKLQLSSIRVFPRGEAQSIRRQCIDGGMKLPD